MSNELEKRQSAVQWIDTYFKRTHPGIYRNIKPVLIAAAEIEKCELAQAHNVGMADVRKETNPEATPWVFPQFESYNYYEQTFAETDINQKD
jgi:hypothetical protein